MLRVDQEKGRDVVYAVLFAAGIAFIVNNRFDMFDQGRLDSVPGGRPVFGLCNSNQSTFH
jgi:hypothetical protein